MRANSSLTAAVAGLVLMAATAVAGQTPGPKPVEPAVRAVHEAERSGRTPSSTPRSRLTRCTRACGGWRGVIDPAAVAAGRVMVVAPAGFMDAVIAESVVAGNAMGRCAAYQFGTPLPRDPRGSVDAGLGTIDGLGAPGRSVIAPTTSITEPLETRVIDGVSMVFQLTPNTEAPAELHLFLPK